MPIPVSTKVVSGVAAVALVLAALALYVELTRQPVRTNTTTNTTPIWHNTTVVQPIWHNATEWRNQTIWHNQTVWHNETRYVNQTFYVYVNETGDEHRHGECPALPQQAKGWGVRQRCGYEDNEEEGEHIM